MFLSKFTSNRIFCARNFAVISYRHLKGVGNFRSSIFTKKKNFKMKRTILMLWVAVALASCSKTPKDANISGKVTELGTMKPLVGTQVVLSKSIETCFLCIPKRVTVGSASTDMEGNFSFIFPDTAITSFYLSFFSGPRYYDKYFLPVPGLFGLGDKRGQSVVNFSMAPEAWIKMHIKNIHPLNEMDEFRFFSNDAKGNGTSIQLSGKYVDTTMIHQCVGGKYIQFGYGGAKMGMFTPVKDSIYTISHDTVSYDFFY